MELNSILSKFGIESQNLTVEEGEIQIAEFKKDNLRKGIIDVLRMARPRTNLEIKLEVEGAKTEVIRFSIEELES